MAEKQKCKNVVIYRNFRQAARWKAQHTACFVQNKEGGALRFFSPDKP
jgi:hypothetical protein